MPKKYQVYWYGVNNSVRTAFLCHCRDNDLWPGSGIPVGAIIEGAIGFAWAEQPVPALTGKIVPFQPNRRCLWHDFELRCMVHPDVPATKLSKPQLRGYNYVVAEFADPAAVKMAGNLKLSLVQVGGGKYLANLEVSSFPRQGKNRRATLI